MCYTKKLYKYMHENKMVSRLCLVVIWYWYKSTFERFLFRFSLLIGSLEVSAADLAIYLCQSEVTSHFCDDTFIGGSRGMPRRIFLKCMGLWNGICCIWSKISRSYMTFFLTAYLIILNKYFGPKKLDFHFQIVL